MPTLESLKSNFLPGNEKNDGSKNSVRQRKKERERERWGREREKEGKREGEKDIGREERGGNGNGREGRRWYEQVKKERGRTQLDKKLKLDSEPVDLFFRRNFFAQLNFDSRIKTIKERMFQKHFFVKKLRNLSD